MDSSKFKVDTIEVEVDYPEIEDFFEIPRFQDVVTLVGFCGGDFQETQILNVKDMNQALNQIEAFDEYGHIASTMGRAIISAWTAGAKYVVIVKAGDVDDLVGLSDDDTAELHYDKLAIAYEVAASMEWSGAILTTDVDFAGYELEYTAQAMTENSEDDHVYEFTHDDATKYTPHISAVYDDGTLVDAEEWTQTFDSPTVTFDAAYTFTGAITCDWYAFIDYAKQLAQACSDSVIDGTFMQGLINCQSNTYADIIAMDSLNDRISWQEINCGYGTIEANPAADIYRFLSAPAGISHVYAAPFGVAFEYGMASVYAGKMTALPADISVAGRAVDNVIVTDRFTKEEADKLSYLGIITYDEPVETRRTGRPRVVCVTDQNLGMHASDYNQNVLMRLVRRVIHRLRAHAEVIIGTNGDTLAEEMDNAIRPFLTEDLIRLHEFKYKRDIRDPRRVFVNLNMMPYFSAKKISISIKAGPFNE